jgi:hypothetical protein
MLITRSKLLSVPKTSRAMVAKRTRETHVPVGEGMQPGTMRTESPSKQGWYLFSPIGNRYGLTVVGLAKLNSRAQGPGLEHPMQGRSGNLRVAGRHPPDRHDSRCSGMGAPGDLIQRSGNRPSDAALAQITHLPAVYLLSYSDCSAVVPPSYSGANIPSPLRSHSAQI